MFVECSKQEQREHQKGVDRGTPTVNIFLIIEHFF